MIPLLQTGEQRSDIICLKPHNLKASQVGVLEPALLTVILHRAFSDREKHHPFVYQQVCPWLCSNNTDQNHTLLRSTVRKQQVSVHQSPPTEDRQALWLCTQG